MKILLVLMFIILLAFCYDFGHVHNDHLILQKQHDELHKEHEKILNMQKETYRVACENGKKLDVLLNIATNRCFDVQISN